MRQLFAVLLLLTLVIYPVLAGDVTLKTGQSEYSFTTGEEARVPFTVESSFPNTNVGTLEYTLTRKEEQSGLSFSQSSTQSQSFPISPGSSQNAITLSSADPTEYEVSLALHFRDSGKDLVSTLPPFIVRFTPNQTAGNTGQTSSGSPNSQGLTSTTSETKPGNQGQSQDPFAEMDQQMNSIRQQNQQILQQALSSQGRSMGSGSSSQPQNAQQALQNNQMNAQSSALQKQLADETARNKQEQQELSQQLTQDPLMNQAVKDLNAAGYQQKDGSVSAQDQGKGSVSASFEDKNGKSVSLAGDIRNGSVEKVTARSRDELPVPQTLSREPRYQEAKKSLAQGGYNQTGGTQSMTLNETRIEEQYQTPDGKNATLTSVIRNGTIEEISVRKPEESPIGWYIGIILLILLTGLCSWAAYKYYQRGKDSSESDIIIVPVEPLDILAETEDLLSGAEKASREGRIKDAYIIVGQALRFFISHTYGKGTADTNEEIISIAKRSRLKDVEYALILERCMLVEYARGEGTEDEVTGFITDIRRIIATNRPEEYPL